MADLQGFLAIILTQRFRRCGSMKVPAMAIDGTVKSEAQSRDFWKFRADVLENDSDATGTKPPC
jgi:hypothetical protein